MIGGLAQWAPQFIYKTSQDTGHHYTNAMTALLFGAITVVGGLGGTIVGSESAKRLHSRLGPAADCYVCAISLLIGGVFAYFSLTLSRNLLILSWVSHMIPLAVALLMFLQILVFIAVFSLCLCWAPVAAIVLVSTVVMVMPDSCFVMVTAEHHHTGTQSNSCGFSDVCVSPARRCLFTTAAWTCKC